MAATISHAKETYGGPAMAIRFYAYQFYENTYPITKFYFGDIGTPNGAIHNRASMGGETTALSDIGLETWGTAYEDGLQTQTVVIRVERPRAVDLAVDVQDAAVEIDVALERKHVAGAERQRVDVEAEVEVALAVCPKQMPLVVELERAVVEVRGADRRPQAIDHDHLLMQERAVVLVQLDAGGEQLLEVPVARMLDDRVVGARHRRQPVGAVEHQRDPTHRVRGAG